MTDWLRSLPIQKMVWISLIVGFVFTINQGVGVSGWLYDLTTELGIVWLGVAFNLVRNTFLASAIVFLALFAGRYWSRTQTESRS